MICPTTWRHFHGRDDERGDFYRARTLRRTSPIPDGLTDEQVLMCPDIMSTGFKGAENANIHIGDTVVVFAQGPGWIWGRLLPMNTGWTILLKLMICLGISGTEC